MRKTEILQMSFRWEEEPIKIYFYPEEETMTVTLTPGNSWYAIQPLPGHKGWGLNIEADSVKASLFYRFVLDSRWGRKEVSVPIAQMRIWYKDLLALGWEKVTDTSLTDNNQ